MKRNLLIALWFTLVTTVMFGVVYPLAITGLAQVLFPSQANGQLIKQNGKIVGSRIVGQSFTEPGYFHSRPSSAGTGYDPTSSSGSNLGPTNKLLIERVRSDVQKLQAENPHVPIPVDLVTASGSGLGPEDRKSTRLNSSHSQISYAVFCLKKKNKTTSFTIYLLYIMIH